MIVHLIMHSGRLIFRHRGSVWGIFSGLLLVVGFRALAARDLYRDLITALRLGIGW